MRWRLAGVVGRVGAGGLGAVFALQSGRALIALQARNGREVVRLGSRPAGSGRGTSTGSWQVLRGREDDGGGASHALLAWADCMARGAGRDGGGGDAVVAGPGGGAGRRRGDASNACNAISACVDCIAGEDGREVVRVGSRSAGSEQVLPLLKERGKNGGSSKGLSPGTLRRRRCGPHPWARQGVGPPRVGVLQGSSRRAEEGGGPWVQGCTSSCGFRAGMRAVDEADDRCW